MKITIESTDKTVTLIEGNGLMPARIWEGFTESGIPVHCYITRIAAPIDDPRLAEFENQLQTHRAPSTEIGAIPNRLIL